MIRVSVPATSANMGSGFDCMGIALTIRNTVEMDLSDHIDITNANGFDLPAGEDNLIYSCAKHVFDIAGKRMDGLKIVEHCNIPMTRGLGSSSACTVAGLCGANALLGDPLDEEAIINLAAIIEGHPDNSTPAIRGGFVAAMLENGRVWQVRVPISGRLRFCAFIPEFELKTEKARAALPKEVTMRDAVFNLSRAALLAGSLVAGELHNIGVATDDRLHQPYRFDMIPEGREVAARARELGALGSFISGAGPTIMAVVDRASLDFEKRVRERFSEEFPSWRVQMLDCDEEGVHIERI